MYVSTLFPYKNHDDDYSHTCKDIADLRKEDRSREHLQTLRTIDSSYATTLKAQISELLTNEGKSFILLLKDDVSAPVRYLE